MTITEFLLARIAEDESFAMSAQAETSIYDEGTIRWHWLIAHSNGSRWHPTTFDPARVLAECEAKRRIVEQATDHCPHPPRIGGWCIKQCDMILRHVASVYADHPDFDPEWRS